MHKDIHTFFWMMISLVRENVRERYMDSDPSTLSGKIENEDEMSPSKALNKLTHDARKFFLPEPGKEKGYILSVCLDLVAFLVWVLLIVFFVPREFAITYWFMPFIGILASVIAMSTSAGGGIVYFPLLTIMSLSARQAAGFSFATQMIGMGAFGAFNWIRKARNIIVWWIVGIMTLGSHVGVSISLLTFPIKANLPLDLVFAAVCLFLFVFVVYGICAGSLDSQDQDIPLNLQSVVICFIFGAFGGLIFGWISVGLEIACFVVLSGVFKMDTRKMTVISVLVTGWTCPFAFLVHLLLYKVCTKVLTYPQYKDIPILLWIYVMGGVIIGSRAGNLLNLLVSKKKILIVFSTLLLLLIVKVIVVNFVLPEFHKIELNQSVGTE